MAMAYKRKMRLDKKTDYVVLLPDDGATASVLVLQKKRAIRVDASVWTEVQWKEYIERRIKASEDGHSLGMNLLENEK